MSTFGLMHQNCHLAKNKDSVGDSQTKDESERCNGGGDSQTKAEDESKGTGDRSVGTGDSGGDR